MKKKLVWLGLSWLVVAALVSVSCGTTVPAGEEQEEEEEEEEEEVVVETVTLKIGETYRSSEVAATVSEVIITDSYEYYDKASDSTLSREPDAGAFFLIAMVYIENVSDSMRFNEGRTRLFVRDSEGKEYVSRSYFGEDVLKPYFQFFAGDEIEGKVLFHIPEGTTGLKIEYRSVEIGTGAAPTRVLAEWVVE